jgi:hypothetical protein
MQSVFLKIPARLVALAAALLLAMLPASALGQSVTDPTSAEFDPSADHNGTMADGAPLVTRYELQFYLAGAGAPFQTGSLGKPAIGGNGRIRVTLASVFAALPSPGIVYESRVAAVGPGGTSTSDVSNSFIFAAAPSCTFAVVPASQTIAQTGGSGSESVTAGAGCPWMATSDAAWLTVTGGENGSGTGTVSFAVAANPSTSARGATLTVAGRAIAFSQAGVACTVSIAPANVSITGSGGSGASSVTSPAGCGWTAASGAAWVTITSGATGSGNGVVNYAVAANTGPARTAALAIGGQTATVSQSENLPAAPGGFRVVRP